MYFILNNIVLHIDYLFQSILCVYIYHADVKCAAYVFVRVWPLEDGYSTQSKHVGAKNCFVQ
jgi:hypothetical protein